MNQISSIIPLLLLDKIIVNALEEDFGVGGDLTSALTVNQFTNSKAEIIARKPGVVACLEVSKRVFNIFDPDLKVDLLVNDGDMIKANTPIISISGKSTSILGAERTALNFLGILSGVATETRKLVDKISGTNTRVCCTRKTIPGLRILQKYAVKCGGGFNHRFGLSDGILIKDNHIKASGGIENAVKEIKSISGHMQKIEIEADNINQVIAAIDSGVDVIMLDNMTLSDIRNAIRIINKKVLVEASGSISVDNIRDIAETGVDIISVGWITHSAPSLDVGLDFKD